MTEIAQRRLLPSSHGSDAKIQLVLLVFVSPVLIRLTASTRTTAHLLLSSSGLQPRSRAPSGALIRTWRGPVGGRNDPRLGSFLQLLYAILRLLLFLQVQHRELTHPV